MREYETFIEDIEKYLRGAIDKFNLKLNLNRSEQEKTPTNTMAFYDNFFCRIGLNNMETFPYQDVVCHYYLVNNIGAEIEIDNKLLNRFLGIDEKHFNEYCINHYKSKSDLVEFKDSDKGGILYGILAINDTILDYYYPLFEGKYPLDSYLNFLENNQS